ncbi:MAG: hypothetical protein HHJ16_05685 [Polaromonas sp.]|uniref:hypothetical protein n=1 Tax=Polaromonas sp. TaxID=1869339 RepID=UPI001810D831|nr:hypothetical protein [Polaromonas sp.]NMM09749.1 hypothetical protein [Polaromonas sp.]
MSIDDRDYMRDRHCASAMESRRFRTSEQHKTRQAEQLKQRFAKYSDSPNRVAVTKAGCKRFVLILLVLVMGAMLFKRVPQISAYFQSREAKAPFPMTGAVRWFIPAPANGVNDMAPLTITGFAEAGRHAVVRLDTWEAHAPVVMIPIRSGETVTLQVPLGCYRISYAPNASWQDEFRLQGEAREGIEPMEFYRTDNRTWGTLLT